MADGKIFETKAEALDYLRKPQKEEALNKLNDNNKELTEWLLENEESICAAFDSNKIRRVTKKDRNSLSKALQKLGQLEIDGVFEPFIPPPPAPPDINKLPQVTDDADVLPYPPCVPT